MSGFTLPCDVYEPGLAYQARVGRTPGRPLLLAGSLVALATAAVAAAPSAGAAPGTPTPPGGVGSSVESAVVVPAALPAAPAVAPAVQAVPADSGQLAALRACESGGNYAAATGNGYYGAYQFDLATWGSLGLSGLPSQASAATQDAAVVSLAQRAGGWSPWPVCGRGLGAVPSSVPVAPAPAALPDVTPEVAPPAPATVLTLIADPAPGTTSDLAPAVPAVADPQLQAWQQRMADRGWPLTADGLFGPQTQRVAASFAAEKQIVEGLPGEIGPEVWAAAWTDPLA